MLILNGRRLSLTDAEIAHYSDVTGMVLDDTSLAYYASNEKKDYSLLTDDELTKIVRHGMEEEISVAVT